MGRIAWMQSFVRVAEAGSFAAAARDWDRSKATVGKQVAALEVHLGVRLFQRTTRRVTLTDAGVAHLPRCRDVLAALHEAEDAVRSHHGRLQGELRVTAPPGFVDRYRRPVFTEFARAHPEVTLDLDVRHHQVDLVRERVDVALRLTRPLDSGLVARRLGPAPLAVVVAPRFLAARGLQPDEGPLTHPQGLAALPCIRDTNFRFDPRWPFAVEGERVEVRVDGPVRANSPLVVRGLVLDALGIGAIPRMLVEADLQEGTLVELFPGALAAGWSIYALTSQRRFVSARARAFLDHVRSVLAAGPPGPSRHRDGPSPTPE